jgi:hypothetical protein
VHLTKPVNLELLLSEIERIVRLPARHGRSKQLSGL